MTWNRFHRQEVRDFLTASSGTDWPGRADQARRLLKKLPEEQLANSARRSAPGSSVVPTNRIDKSALPFAPPSGGPPKAARRAARNETLFWRVRPKAFRRCREWFSNRCEFCHVGPPEEAHHVLKGSDKVAEESEATLAVVCEDCHGRTEESPAWARAKGLLWARRCADRARQRGLAELAAAFDRTAEILEGKIALAEAKGFAKEETARG